MSLAVINLFMQLGLATSVSAAQTIFRNQLPLYLAEYAPGIDAQVVVDAGATNVRQLVSAPDMPGFLHAYNLAITDMFVSLVLCSTAFFFPRRLRRISADQGRYRLVLICASN